MGKLRKATKKADKSGSHSASEPKQKKAGLLAGKVRNLLPEALDAKLLAPKDADDDDEDGPPEEVATISGPAGDEPPEEVQNTTADITELEAPKPRQSKAKKSGKSGKSAGSTVPEKKAKFLWQDPENKELFDVLKEQDEQRRRRRQGAMRVQKGAF